MSLVKEHEWCPVIPWLLVNAAAVEPPATPSMVEGVEAHRDGLPGEVAGLLGYRDPLFNVYMESREDMVAGVVDIVAPGEGEVAEAKRYVTRRHRHHLAQLRVYALLALRNGHRPRVARLATPRGVVRSLEVGPALVEEAERLVEATWRTVESPDPPLVEQPARKCMYCRYRSICPYRAP